MGRAPRTRDLTGLRQAFDDVRFGQGRTLNLREDLPTADEATARGESWLRQHQALGTDDVLIITGRGNNSEGGVSAVREAVISLFHSLRRRNVIAAYQEHTPGSFIVTLAPLRALVDAPRRRRERAAPPRVADPSSLEALSPDTRLLLRHLAERTLEGLGIAHTDQFLAAEMLKQFGAIAVGVPEGPDRDARLAAALRVALDQHE